MDEWMDVMNRNRRDDWWIHGWMDGCDESRMMDQNMNDRRGSLVTAPVNDE